MNIAVLIPSLDPNERLGTLVSELRQRGVTQLVVIDDGSAARTQPIFDLCASLGCIVVHHDRNRGKGEALRTGLRAAREHFPNLAGVVTADGDGQHRVNDILRVAHALETTASGLILGTRDFSADSEIASPRCFSVFLQVSAVRTHRPVCAAFPPHCLILLCRFPAAGTSTR